MIEKAILGFDEALKTIYGHQHSRTAYPGEQVKKTQSAQETGHAILNEDEKKLAAALMRVNHVGEVCAQALYNAQAYATQDIALQKHFKEAAKEEGDHLAWTRQRIEDLGGRTSLLNPLWYAGAFGLGLVAGRFGDKVSLGFVVETEKQVEAHLDEHLNRLPAQDWASRAVVEQMKQDEIRHAKEAQLKGAIELPLPVKGLMKAAAKVMTTVAHRI